MIGRALLRGSSGVAHLCDRIALFGIRATHKPLSQQRTILMVFAGLLGLFAYGALLFALPSRWQKNQSSDYAGYYGPVAANLVGGKGFVLGSKPPLQYPPGMPLLYAATFWISDVVATDRRIGLRVLQGLFAISSSVLVGLLAMRVFNLRVAFAASFLWSTYPFHLWLTKQPDGSAALTTLLLSAVLFFLLWADDPSHPWWYGLALGAIIAIAALIKPFCIALPIVFGCLVWICDVDGSRGHRWIFSACVLIAYISLITPWEIWAWRASGQWIPLCTNGPNALIDGITFGTVRGVRPIPMPVAVRALTNEAVLHYQELKTTASIVRFVITKAREKPMAVVGLFSLKAVRSWYGSESQSLERIVVMIQLCYLPFVIFGLRRAWRGDRQQKNFVLVALGMVLYFWTMTLFTALPILRYMVPAVSLLLVCAANCSRHLQPQSLEQSYDLD